MGLLNDIIGDKAEKKLKNIVDRVTSNLPGEGDKNKRTEKCLEELKKKGITEFCSEGGQKVTPIGITASIPWTKDDITPGCLKIFASEQKISPNHCKQPQPKPDIKKCAEFRKLDCLEYKNKADYTKVAESMSIAQENCPSYLEKWEPGPLDYAIRLHKSNEIPGHLEPQYLFDRCKELYQIGTDIYNGQLHNDGL